MHLRRMLRRFQRAPGYTLVSVATLGLGVGAITAVRLAGTGMILGVVAAAGVTRLMETLLYGIGPLDAGSFASASLVLLGVAAGAAAIPAARACRLDPVAVIRDE